MEKEYWHQKWSDNDIAFHRREYHPHLLRFWSELAPARVLVPLCGKSRDMEWLRQQGHEVVGVELEAKACEAFFEESELPYERRDEGAFRVYSAPGITLWCGDLFTLPTTATQGTSLIYDRAALVALPSGQRERYASCLKNHFHREAGKQSQVLLISFEYPQGLVDGPPFSVTSEEIKSLYSDFSVEEIYRGVDAMFKTHRKFKDVTTVTEVVYRLT